MSEPAGPLALSCVLGYLLGSIPFGVLVARAMGVDIMAVGSGNIGATNVNRALGWRAALPVLLLDVLKGLAPALVARYAFGLGADGALLSGVAAVLGHSFSPFLRFRGGKGIATALGAAIGSIPLIALCALGVFSVLYAVTQYVSLSSMVAVPSTLLWAAMLGSSPVRYAVLAALSALVVFRHRANIARLIAGTEPKTPLRGRSFAKPEADAPSSPGGA